VGVAQDNQAGEVLIWRENRFFVLRRIVM